MSFINLFFDRTFELEINELMFDKKYNFPNESVYDYILKICELNFNDIFQYIYSSIEISPILSENIFQFSSFEDCTENFCKILINNGDKGFRYNEIGKMFEVIPRNDMANRKYGENASKTAKELGLCQIIENYVFLSCIGNVFLDLKEEQKRKLIVMLILRSKYFSTLFYLSKNDKIDSCILMSALSEKTKIRRKSNIKKLLLILKEYNDPYLNEKLNNIIF